MVTMVNIYGYHLMYHDKGVNLVTMVNIYGYHLMYHDKGLTWLPWLPWLPSNVSR